MAAIIQPRTHHHGPTGAALRPSRPPRHLSAVTMPAAAGTAAPAPVRSHAGTVAADPLVSTGTLAAMAAAVLVAVLLALGVGQGLFAALVPAPGSEPIAATDARVVVVEPGDSVWSIARAVQPEGDLRPLVHRIVQANGAAPLQPGQRITVPA